MNKGNPADFTGGQAALFGGLVTRTRKTKVLMYNSTPTDNKSSYLGIERQKQLQVQGNEPLKHSVAKSSPMSSTKINGGVKTIYVTVSKTENSL